VVWRSGIHYLVYLLVRVAIMVVQALSIEACQAGCRRLARLLADSLAIRGKVVDENLRLAFPSSTQGERRRICRQMWEHLLLLAVEVAHAPRKIHDTNWRDYVRLKDARKLVRALLTDRPTIIVSAHFGNFELAGFVLGILGFPSYTVARTLDNPYLDRFISEFRGKSGQRILAKKGDYEKIEKILEGRGVLAFLADQYAGAKGCWVDFFGVPASTHKAIALFSLHHDAPLVVGYARRLGAPLMYEFGIQSLADPRSEADEVRGIRELTQWYTRQLEQLIRQAPEQYWWVHRRWKGRPPGRRAA
jgi:KDO2-lipid IV(A) lauroyltransferase